MTKPKTVDEYIAQSGDWADGLTTLRAIALDVGLEETVKWSAPCYMHAGRNVILLAGFKDYFGIWFENAESLDDPDGVLQQAKGGSSKTMKQWRFSSPKEIKKTKVKAYLRAAMTQAEQHTPKKKPRAITFDMPPELAAAFKKAPKTMKAFDQLSPGKQRDYAQHIAEAKRDATKRSRLEKILPMIADGKGLHDKYKNC